MSNLDKNPFLNIRNSVVEVDKENLALQLDKFANEHNIKSLRDRLKWGLNEVGILAYDQTNAKVQELCKIFSETKEGADSLYDYLTEMCVEIQEHGPWDFAKDLAEADAAHVKLWYILNTAESLGYEKEMELNDQEFNQDLQRISEHLDNAINNPDDFFELAKEHIRNKSAAAIYFDEDDKDKKIPRGEGLQTALPMALQGYEVGIAHDSDGWVYVIAQGMISDRLLESCGLTKKIQKDPRDPSRKVTLFLNNQGQEVVKKVHRGFLVILTKSFDLAQAIAEAVRDQKDVIKITDEALGHTRVIQTTEKQRLDNKAKDEEHWFRKQFLRRSKISGLEADTRETTALTSPKQDFYNQMLYIRGLYVYLDAVEKAEREKEEEGKKLTDFDREVISERVWSKMKQKVEELEYVNELLQKEAHGITPNVRAVIDMAGGAGDLGLAVGTELMAQGRELKDIEIVDPQKGVDDFMENIIEHIPFREDFQKIAHHNTGYLQDANIRPDSIVVAKHACGTLTDAIIEQWINSESPMLVAMTCCQDKAKDMPARYGLEQRRWHDLCVLSGATGQEVPEEPGVQRDIALKELERGKQAMYELDMARVEHLRRNGYKAELHTTDKFPKGDVIIARRLPNNFMVKLNELKKLETDDPNAYDAMIMKLDKMARGGNVKKEREVLFGEKWIDDDFEELLDRLSPARIAREDEITANRRLKATELYLIKQEEDRRQEEAKIVAERKKAEKAEYEKYVMTVFPEAKGKPNVFVTQWSQSHEVKIVKNQMGKIMSEINTILRENRSKESSIVRAMVEAYLIEELA
jgi:hypothetical protein